MQNLNEEQRRCFRITQMGHNLLVLGKVGSGKTHLLRFMIDEYNRNKNIAVTASTGMSRLQFQGGDTLHHWSAYGDGHLDLNTIIGRIHLNPSYESIKKNIMEAEILIIDEIGLVSGKMLEYVEQICRSIRNNDIVFGGLQVIAAGSFTQLPPVPSPSDPGLYCFEASKFSVMFPHKIQLNKVFRQKEPDLVDAVNELCQGKPSDKTHVLIRSLARPLHPDMKPVYIFGTNFDVTYFNMDQLHNLQGPMKTYYSVDEGDRKLLKKCTAPHILPLKVDCKVIVIRNLPNGLVNGLSGTVLELSDDSVKIKIDDDPYLGHGMAGVDFDLQRFTFLIRDKHNKVCAVRKQFPLCLGYALTVHKSQGRSIPELVVDAYNFWRAGQLGVAIGRATCKEGLQVQNYNTFAATLQHPDSVTDFYNSRSFTVKGDKSCCTSNLKDDRLHVFDTNLEINTQLDPNELEEMNFRRRVQQKFPYDLDEFFESIKLPEYTDWQKDRNSEFEKALPTPEFRRFLNYTHDKVVYFVDSYRLPPKGVKCNWCAMVAHIDKFLISTQHISCCKKGFKCKELSELQNEICTEIFWELLKRYTQPVQVESSSETEHLDPSTLHPDLRKKIRYIAGATVTHVAQKLKSSVNHKLLHKYEQAKSGFRAVQILNTLRVPQSAIVKESTDSDSLMEVMRRQWSSQGLTHVTDKCYNFFCNMYCTMVSKQNDKEILKDPKNVNAKTISHLQENADLLQQWIELFEHQSDQCICEGESENEEASNIKYSSWEENVLQCEVEHLLVVDMYEMAVQYFCRTHFSDLLGKYKENIGQKKQLALRHSIHNVAKKKEVIAKEVDFPCGVCGKECIDVDTDDDSSENSVECDKCNKWFHYICVALTGKEKELKPGSKLPYFCPNCKDETPKKRSNPYCGKGKGVGKKSKAAAAERVFVEEPSKTRSGRIRKAPDKMNL